MATKILKSVLRIPHVDVPSSEKNVKRSMFISTNRKPLRTYRRTVPLMGSFSKNLEHGHVEGGRVEPPGVLPSFATGNRNLKSVQLSPAA